MKLILCFALLAALAFPADETMKAYKLGPGDQILIQLVEGEGFDQGPVRVNQQGFIKIPYAGRVDVGGKTLDKVEEEISLKLNEYLRDPEVIVSISEFRSQPVSVFGSVVRPGVMQLRGPKSLWEVITEAGGFQNDVGNTIRITRQLDQGEVPLPNAHPDETGKYSVVEVDARSVMEMKNPEENILMMANDVVSVSQANVVYVVGRVNRAGGYVIDGSISLLETLSMAGGFQEYAKPKDAKILRLRADSDQRQVISVDLKAILNGKGEDLAMKPQDILYVPHSSWQHFGIRLAESAAMAAAGAVIYGGIRGPYN